MSPEGLNFGRRDEEEAKDLDARSKLFAQREALRERHRKGQISEADFKREESELNEMIDDLGSR